MTAPTPAAVACGATVLQARGRRLCKTIRPGREVIGYDSAKTFDLYAVPLASLADLHALLAGLARRSDCALVRGAPVNPEGSRGVRRLLYDDAETGDAATLRDVPRCWLALDLDGLPVPAGTDPRDLAACARAVLPSLPVAFQHAAAVVQATASHCIKSGARLRLWYWLSRPTSGAELKLWLGKAPVDRSVFGGAQPIYTASPAFVDGAADPVTARLLLLRGEHEVVAVPAAAVLAPVRRSTPLAVPSRKDGSRYAAAALSRAAAAIRGGASGRHPTAVQEALGMARLIRAGLLTEAEVQRAFADALDVPGRTAAGDEAAKLLAWGLANADARPAPDGVR